MDTTGTRNETGLTTLTGILAGVAAVLLVVLGVLGVQSLGSDDEGSDTDPVASGESTSPSPSEDDPSESPTAKPTEEAWLAVARTAAKDGFPAFVPSEMPKGWAGGDGEYTKDTSWRMTVTSPTGAEVVITQRDADLEKMVAGELGQAKEAGTVNLTRWGTGRWQAFEAGDTAALAKTLPSTTVVVSGKTSQDEIVELTRMLLTADMSVNVGDGSDG